MPNLLGLSGAQPQKTSTLRPDLYWTLVVWYLDEPQPVA